MKVVNANDITKAVSKLCISANINADEKICNAIKKARDNETEALAVSALDMIIDNMDIAAKEKMPMCQDTGLVVVFVDIGQNVFVDGSIKDAINEGVRQGYKNGYFRASVVKDPLDRVNTKDNTPAVIHYNIVDGDKLKITVMPKGFGSENKSALKMLTPSAGIKGIEDFVIETVKKAGSDPCPPIIVGVGIGGTMEKAALLAKEALLTIPCEETTPFEDELLIKINNLNIGAAGFKGKATALGVKVLTYPTHIAGLPVAVNIGCHVSRHKSIEI